MADMNTEWGFYQIPHTGLVGVENEHVRTDTDVVFRRSSDMKIANFGALNVGIRMSDDYTRTELTYWTKDDLADWRVQTADDAMGRRDGLRGTTIDENPYIWGSTVKKARDDQFFRMYMEHSPTSETLLADSELAPLYPAGDAASIDKPKFDVMDTNEVTAEGIMADGESVYKNYPSEGFRSFGGKYDYLPYTGVLGRPRYNFGV